MSNDNSKQIDTSLETATIAGGTNSMMCCFGGCPVPRWLDHDAQKEEVKQRMDHERQEGQALLRSMVTASFDDQVDWQAIITKAEELHSREQELLKQQTGQERHLFVQRQKKALQKRRKFDSIGSFSINLLTYRMEPSATDPRKALSETSEGSTRDDENSLGSHSAPSSPPPIMGCSSNVQNYDTAPVMDTRAIDQIEELDQSGEEDRPTDPLSPPMILSQSTSSDMFVIDDQLQGVGVLDDNDFGSV